MTTISHVHAREILDSRGTPTVEVCVQLENGAEGSAAVPSGASTGAHEATELRDGNRTRYGGKGVLKAIENVNNRISFAITGFSPYDQEAIDSCLINLDGTSDKSYLGANATLGVSLAVARAAAHSRNLPLYRHIGSDKSHFVLPVPMFNILNGGRHAADSADIQEFMVVPAGLTSFQAALQCGAEVYQALKDILRRGGFSTNVGDEGGFAPTMQSNRDAIEAVLAAIEQAGYQPGRDCFIALDAAASEFYRDGIYTLEREGTQLSSVEMVELLAAWAESYPILSIEDGLAEDDWNGWTLLMERLGKTVQIVGDDLYTTNSERIRHGLQSKASNAVLIKLNQIGTLTETLDAIRITQQANWGAVISHRSGETGDTTISDLAVAVNAGQIKSGAPARGERVAKYNRLAHIEEELGARASYAGRDAFPV